MAARTRSQRGAAVGLGAALAATAIVLSACGGSETASGEGVTLSWFVFPEPGGAYTEAAAKCSEESDGRYTIEQELLPTDADQQREQLVRRLGAEDDTIDIIGMDVIWTAEFANAGWIEEWTGAQAQEVTKDVFPSVVDTASFEGKVYAAPFTSNTQLLWYRKDRVEKAPKTWDEMIQEAERIGEGGTIQVQADQYEGFTVLVAALISSAGTELISGPESVELEEGPTVDALTVLGTLANSPAVADDIDTSTEDTARLSFEAGDSSFMLNYPFVYPSAKENAPDVFKQLGFAEYPQVVPGEPSAPPLGGINLAVSAYSPDKELAFEAAACLREEPNQVIAAELGGLPPTLETAYAEKTVQDAYPGFSDLIKSSIDAAAPRPLTPAYTDLSLAIQSTLHPPEEVDPDDAEATYDELRSALEDAVKREGLL